MGGFKDFLMRGNLIQLATAVIIGFAFNTLVTSFTTGLVTPILGIFGAIPSFREHSFTIGASKFLYGEFIDALLNFVLTAAVLYYVVIFPWNYFTAKEVDSVMRDCPECQLSIKKKATRCPNCTSAVEPILPEPEEEIKAVEKPAESPKKNEPEPV